jgi:uncharacterized protein (TIGR02246 family)
MRIIFALLAAVFLLACQTALAPETSKAEIAAVTQKWIEGMTRHDVDSVVALYDSEAVLWGTRSPTLRDNPSKVREYFNMLRTVPPTYKAVLGEQRIRVYGNLAINTGTYTFSELRDGKEVVRPARFSFVFRNVNGRWLIIDHHSSAMPEQT